MNRVAYYGGSFNPPHVGHLMTIAYTLATAGVSEVLMAPVFQHPDGKELVDFNQRMQMCELLVRDFVNVRVTAAEQSASLAGSHGYTVNTLKHLMATTSQPTTYVLVLGSDLLTAFEHWHGYKDLLRLKLEGKLDFFYIGREGHGTSPIRMPSISSTTIRSLMLSTDPMSVGMVAAMVPHSVLRYVKEKKLYGM